VAGPSAPAYLAPPTLHQALAALASGDRLVLAGATDVYPAAVGRPIVQPVLDVTGLPGLDRVVLDGAHWRVPALVTWSGIADADLPPLFDGLRAAARTIGGVQIQNVATICGNLCNASPAADGVPNLLALGASVELASLRGTRRLPVEEFVLANRVTARAPDELVTAVLVPAVRSGPRAGVRSGFVKLGSRAHLVISIVMVAAVVEIEDGVVRHARVAVGACAPTARRLPGLEAALTGRPIGDSSGAADLVRPEHLAPLDPIDDIRGTAAYRLDATRTLLRRLAAELLRPAGSPAPGPTGGER
jgi:CO/xanthine dehydrogenase FAD-binding subunit